MCGEELDKPYSLPCRKHYVGQCCMEKLQEELDKKRDAEDESDKDNDSEDDEMTADDDEESDSDSEEEEMDDDSDEDEEKDAKVMCTVDDCDTEIPVGFEWRVDTVALENR